MDPPVVSIDLEEVTKRFLPGAPPAVDALTLSVPSGEIFALLGPSGCGKTTTLRLVAGFERPDGGRIRVAGRLVDDGARRVPPEERAIGFVFQDYALFPHLTVARNVGFGLRRLASEEKRRRVAGVLLLCSLGGLEDRYPHELSGGQQQRAAVARALAPDFPLVLLDEPLSNLDASLRASLRADLHEILKASGKTTLLVTHDRDEAFEMADRVGVLVAGRLVQVGSPEELHERPATGEVARLVCDANLIPARLEGGECRTEVGVFPLPPSHAIDGEVEVLLREDALALEPDESGSAVVTAHVFRGPEHLFRARLGSGAEIRCRRPSSADLAVGQRVRVTLRPEAARLLPKSS